MTRDAASVARCVWCGRRTSHRRYKSCSDHRDLELALRAYYSPNSYADLSATKGTASR